MNQINNKNLSTKIFLILSIFFNIILIFFIFRELFNLIQIRNNLTVVNEGLENLSKLKRIKNLEQINAKYVTLLEPMSTENNLGELIKFVENKSIDNELNIIETKVLTVNNSEIKFQITLEGEMKNIYRFVNDIENDKNPKEITKSIIEIRNNLPNVTLEIKGFIL